MHHLSISVSATEHVLCACSEQLRQHAQWGKRGLSPPQEEDRKLPLQKLFDNLHEFEQTVPAPVSAFLNFDLHCMVMHTPSHW